jgi:hypothetical protein
MLISLKKSNQHSQTIISQTGSLYNEETGEFDISPEDKYKISLIEGFVENLTGKKIKIKIPIINIKDYEKPDPEKTNGMKLIQQSIKQNSNNSNGWGLIYNSQRTSSEKEQLSYSAEGIVKTSDGKELKIDLSLNMSREFVERSNFSIRAGNAKIDPLIINFDGKAPELTDTKFSFDLDVDGTTDQISFLKSGSGFLALDSNNDGEINNGSELFGPQSGDGFADLSSYDHDRNGWIDENDSVFEKLRIWTKDSEGNDYLLALGEKGIGAIYLGHISTLFDLKDTQNQMAGQVQETGIFVKEDGSAGTIQHVDLSV